MEFVLPVGVQTGGKMNKQERKTAMKKLKLGIRLTVKESEYVNAVLKGKK